MNYMNIQYDFASDGLYGMSIVTDRDGHQTCVGNTAMNFTVSCQESIKALHEYLVVFSMLDEDTSIWDDFTDIYLCEARHNVHKTLPEPIADEFIYGDYSYDELQKWCERVLNEIKPPEKPKSGWYQPELPIS
tara:strand:+ start:1363 stop:1761 length:399 start_codon:yes stop_codon:yes gene_type:complete